MINVQRRACKEEEMKAGGGNKGRKEGMLEGRQEGKNAGQKDGGMKAGGRHEGRMTRIVFVVYHACRMLFWCVSGVTFSIVIIQIGKPAR